MQCSQLSDWRSEFTSCHGPTIDVHNLSLTLKGCFSDIVVEGHVRERLKTVKIKAADAPTEVVLRKSTSNPPLTAEHPCLLNSGTNLYVIYRICGI